MFFFSILFLRKNLNLTYTIPELLLESIRFVATFRLALLFNPLTYFNQTFFNIPWNKTCLIQKWLNQKNSDGFL